MPVIEANHFELVDVEFVKEAGTRYLRLYIDKEGGITIDDCELVSRAFGELLDREDFIEESYILEVSSPGLGRPLKKDKDFARSIGSEVEIRLFKPLSKEKKEKEFFGILKSYDEGHVTIEQEDGCSAKFSLRCVAPYNVARDVAQPLGGGGHERAAGITIHRPLDEALNMVLARVREIL